MMSDPRDPAEAGRSKVSRDGMSANGTETPRSQPFAFGEDLVAGHRPVDASIDGGSFATAPASTTSGDGLDPIADSTIDVQASPKRSHVPEEVRLAYEAALARDEDRQDREVAARIADSEQYRNRLRRQGFDVPEPPTWDEADDVFSHPVTAEEEATDGQRYERDRTSNSPTPAAEHAATHEQSVVTPPPTVGPGLPPATAVEGRTRGELARLIRGEE